MLKIGHTNINTIFENFAELLDKRLKCQIYTTEDSIRYTFFASLIRNGVEPHHLVLEFPHPSIKKAKIDMWLIYEEKSPIAFEFKYDRDVPSSLPVTQKAVKIFEDFYRLSQTGVLSYFIYVTNGKMANYLSNPNNGHTELWNLEYGEEINIDQNYFSNKPKEFDDISTKLKAKIGGKFKCTLLNNHYLRTYEVKLP
ncbi:MAG: hypothetical protein LWW94_10945 [Candidatus Desulfofervidaceae bacterium]|nr:hypothetical protein [Candidatus Desulfofervidaceae bacterium]